MKTDIYSIGNMNYTIIDGVRIDWQPNMANFDEAASFQFELGLNVQCTCIFRHRYSREL